MRILGLIPARGGSKGVVRKNLKPLNGIPLIAYTIEQALSSSLLDRVVVSTEDEEIATKSKDLGADVPFMRPLELAQDESPTIDTILHALQYFKEKGENFDAVCLLQPTVPFRKAGSIELAIQQFVSTDADSLISVQEIPHQFNPNWAFIQGKNKQYLTLANGEDKIISRRQELPKAFYRDGAIYITKSEVLLENISLYGERITYLENNGKPLINIDTEEDWALAEQYISDHGS
ncbi:MAG: acylneuraminate cytidylyltransferase family protein [Flavobacteriales bacterium]|nr:acylneuraminate cytidylyltransferase family protein [Flavobacteriales bacterium]